MKMSSRIATGLLPALVSLAISSIALAQGGGGPRQPKVDAVPSPVVGYAIMLILAIAILSISLYPSKRAHTDL